MRRCPHCKVRMFDLVPLIGRDPGPRICAHCWGLGVRWRDLDTMKITYGSTTARRYVYASLAVDPGKEDGPYTSARGVLLWSHCSLEARAFMGSLHIPPASQEGPRRV